MYGPNTIYVFHVIFAPDYETKIIEVQAESVKTAFFNVLCQIDGNIREIQLFDMKPA